MSKERVIKDFMELVSIDSLSYHEREMADAVKERLASLDFELEEDDAGKFYNGNAGNIYGFLKGELPGAPILFSSHTDTVKPGIGKKPVLHEDGRITSAGDTILGADDVSGICEIIEGIRRLKEEGIPHRDVEIMFPIGEELYNRGSKVFDYGKIKAKECYVMDLSGSVGTASNVAPSLISFKAVIHGKSAHAGFEPEKGIHAVKVLANAVSRLELGKLPGEVTRNISIISGGELTNIVPDTAIAEGEARSLDHERAMAAIEEAERVFKEEAEKLGATVDFETEVHIKAYKIEETEPVATRFKEACEKLGIAPRLVDTLGGSDNNIYVEKGIRGIVVSCGMENVHSVNEFIRTEDLETGSRLVMELLRSEI